MFDRKLGSQASPCHRDFFDKPLMKFLATFNVLFLDIVVVNLLHYKSSLARAKVVSIANREIDNYHVK
ncbi:hypothetical protein [Coleofasciculus sp. G1-WW12-02]|uniref:hypothetical protein n=1 Tax=Coleofasciculus sp. G1-WW12-02 TaxID=3068483 RepID=UPI0040634298